MPALNRIKRYTEQVFKENKTEFGLDFTENKKALERLAIIRSKELKNEIAGFITRTIRKEKRDADERRRRADADAALEKDSQDMAETDVPDDVLMQDDDPN